MSAVADEPVQIPDERILRTSAVRSLLSRPELGSLVGAVAVFLFFAFAADGFLAYRTLRETAVVSGDPVGPAGAAPEILRDFVEHANARGWDVVVTGASSAYIDGYREAGMRSLKIGEEAVVDPAAFSLEGRKIRKVRQAVARVARRGWAVQVVGPGGVKAAELEAVERAGAKAGNKGWDAAVAALELVSLLGALQES